jgi:Tol biopolymer transport system component
MRRSLRLVIVFTAVVVPACGKPSTNTAVANQTRTFVPPQGADIGFTANDWSTDTGAGREVFAVRIDGSERTRLTFCNEGAQPCDTVEAAFAPDHARVAARQRFTSDDVESLVFIDLARSGSAELVSSSQHVSGVDWSRAADTLAYSAIGTTSVDDLFRTDVKRPTTDNQQNTVNLTCLPAGNTAGIVCDPTIADRRPRIDPTGSTAVFERIPPGGKGDVYIFQTTASQTLVAPAGPGTSPLPGTPYFVGSNADPAFSPDAGSIVFRRLTATGNGSLGSWDILAVKSDGSGLALIVTGPAYRGAPDWGAQGIVFPEGNPATGQYSLVVVQPDGSGRRTVLTLDPGFVLSNPRWLK